MTTDGDSDVEPNVVVNLPTNSYWYVFDENSGSQMFSLPKGGQPPLSAAAAGMYLRCVFDTHGFTTARPLACWALRV